MIQNDAKIRKVFDSRSDSRSRRCSSGNSISEKINPIRTRQRKPRRRRQQFGRFPSRLRGAHMTNPKKLMRPWYAEMKSQKIALLKEEREAAERGDAARAEECRREIDKLDPPESAQRRRERSGEQAEKRKQKRSGGGLGSAILQLVQGTDSYFSDWRKKTSVVAVLQSEAPNAEPEVFQIAEQVDALRKPRLSDAETALRTDLRAKLHQRLVESGLPDWATLGASMLAQQTPVASSVKEFAAYLRKVEHSVIDEEGALLDHPAARELAKHCHERSVLLLEKCATSRFSSSVSNRLSHVCKALEELLHSAAEQA